MGTQRLVEWRKIMTHQSLYAPNFFVLICLSLLHSTKISNCEVDGIQDPI